MCENEQTVTGKSILVNRSGIADHCHCTYFKYQYCAFNAWYLDVILFWRAAAYFWYGIVYFRCGYVHDSNGRRYWCNDE